MGRCCIVDKASAYGAKGPGFKIWWRQQFIDVCSVHLIKIKLRLGPTLKKNCKLQILLLNSLNQYTWNPNTGHSNSGGMNRQMPLKFTSGIQSVQNMEILLSKMSKIQMAIQKPNIQQSATLLKLSYWTSLIFK